MIHYLAGLIKVIENAHHLSDIDYHRTLDQDTEKWRKRLRTLRWAHDKLCEVSNPGRLIRSSFGHAPIYFLYKTGY